jgi:hypothetical protein
LKSDSSSKSETECLYNINMYYEEVGYDGVDFSHVAHA